MSNKLKTNKDQNQRPNPYLIDKLAKVPNWIKIDLLKFWIVGAAFYYCINGLSFILNVLDSILVFYLIMVLAIEYISNTIILWMHTEERPTKWFLPHEINRKSVLSLLGTALYCLIVGGIVLFLLDTWVGWGLPTFGTLMSGAVGDPITFSLLFLLFDFGWISIRKALKKAIKKG